MKLRFWLGLIILCLVLLEFSSYAATWLDPALKWKTIETPHFFIHFPEELEDVANRFVPIAEKVYKVMTKVMKYKIDGKTQVVLLDNTDYGNGFTTVFPYPLITLYLSDLSSNLSPYRYDDYLYYLFLHEYTHALHLDICEGAPALFRLIFGRMIFPNAFEPQFMVEGLATYMETKYTGGGRGKDPRWEAMMRMDILEDSVKHIDQAAVNTVSWPMGHLRYLYGVYFLDYLAETYGEDKLISLAHVYGDFFFSLGVDSAFVFLYRKNLSMLWNEWLDYLNSKFENQKVKLGKLTEPKLLTETGYYNLKPKWSKDSGFIYYFQRNSDDYPQLRRIDYATKINEKVLEGLVFDEQFSFSPDGRYLIFSKADTYKNYYTFKDLYQLDLYSRKVTRITEGLRAFDPCFSPDGTKIVFVRNQKGSKSLWLLEKGKAVLLTAEAGAQYFSPSFSPDGKKIVAAKQIKGGYQKIVLIDLDSKKEEILNKQELTSIEANPCFTPDGQYVLFESDRTGIVNIYAYQLKTNKLFQVTNVLGIAAMPDVSPDGKKLAYVSYSSRGYDIAVIDFDSSLWKEVLPQGQSPPQLEKKTIEDNSVKYRIYDYNPWPTLIPKFWIPYSYYNENGDHTSFYLGSTDPLGQHLYYLNFGYDSEGGKPFGIWYYANNQFLPQITVAFSDFSTAYDWGGITYWERQREGDILFSFYANRVAHEYDRQAFTFGFGSIKLDNITSLGVLNPRPSLGNLNAFILAWRYLSARTFLRSISPEDGLDIGFKVEIFTPLLGSDYKNVTYSAFFKNYIKSLFPHQVLASNVSGFYSRGDQLEQSGLTWRYLSLRGYPGTFLKGNKGVLLSLEYRFPLWYMERGFLYGYTFLDRIYGLFFYDWGGATFETFDRLKLKRAVGVEAGFDLSNLWGYIPMTLKIGYTKGLDEGGVEKFYFNLGL